MANSQSNQSQVGVCRIGTRGSDLALWQAHTIKGASANVSGEALSEAAMGLEKASSSKDMNAARAGLATLEAQFEKLKAAMDQPA